MKKILSLILTAVIALSALAFTSCSGKNEYPVTAYGITINEEPENIVILNKNLADIISCIGYNEKLVGRSDSVNQKGMHVVESVGSASEPSYDKIKKLKTDIVFADKSLKTEAKTKLEKNNIQVIIPKNADTPEEIKKLYLILGSVLGGNISGKAKAKKAYNILFDSLDGVKDAVTEKDVVRTICYLYYDNDVIKTVTQNDWGAKMLDYTGAANVFMNDKEKEVNLRKLLRSNPDYIFCSDKKVIEELKSHKKLVKYLSALKKNRCIIPYDEITMQGDTSLDTLKKMLQFMYPEDFK